MQGNLDYQPIVEDHDNASVADKQLLRNIATMLSVSPDDLEKALCSRVIAAGGQVLEKGLAVSDALYARDAFSKV